MTLFVSGCTHHCKGCFNPDQWSFDYGKPFAREVEDRILGLLEPSHIAGMSILGGEPMEPANQRALLPFLRRLRERFGARKTIWVYTGCVLEELVSSSRDKNVASPLTSQCKGDATFLSRDEKASSASSRWRTEATDELLSLIDVLVDGPFIEELKDISL